MNNSSINLDEAREYILKITLEAGEVLKKYFTTRNFTSRSKGGVDLLTQADKEVDDFLRNSIKKHFPKCEVMAEESAPRDYSSFKDLNNLWLIDPLDGTTNFSRGHPHFSISIGLVDKGISKLGVVHVPMTNDLYWAQQDRVGAFHNGKPIKVAVTDNLKETVLACDYGWILEQRISVVNWLSSIVTHVRQIKSMGTAAADLASLANGSIDVYIHSGLKPWDTAASSLLIEKAGGKITTPTGEKWDVFNPNMLATNGILHQQILDLINK